MKKIVILFIMCLLICCGCGKSSKNPIVTMEIEDYGTVRMELYPKIAPNTVANFVNLIEDGFYDGLTFHRLVKGFVLQGGDPLGNGTGGPGYSIKGEFRENGVNNNLVHSTGIISMARSNSYDSAGSQFFIILDDSAKYSLDGKYAGFGKVIEGMDIIKKLEEEAIVKDEETGALEENITITQMTVDTFETEYKVEKITP